MAHNDALRRRETRRNALFTVPMALFESVSWDMLLAAAVPILYAGVLSCGVAYTLQIIGQKNMNPTIASLILSLESCISVLAGWIILGQSLSLREILGCVIMFGAIILAQLPQKSSTAPAAGRSPAPVPEAKTRYSRK